MYSNRDKRPVRSQSLQPETRPRVAPVLSGSRICPARPLNVTEGFESQIIGPTCSSHEQEEGSESEDISQGGFEVDNSVFEEDRYDATDEQETKSAHRPQQAAHLFSYGSFIGNYAGPNVNQINGLYLSGTPSFVSMFTNKSSWVDNTKCGPGRQVNGTNIEIYGVPEKIIEISELIGQFENNTVNAVASHPEEPPTQKNIAIVRQKEVMTKNCAARMAT